MSLGSVRHLAGAAVVAAAALAILPLPAQAGSITFNLNQNGCSSNCLPGNISGGTVVITDGLETGEVQVLVTLAPNFHFANSSGKGQLTFNLSGSPTIGIDDLNDTTNFSLVSTTAGTLSMPPFGDFTYGIVCGTCQGGQTTNPTGPVSFDVVLTGVTVNSFIGNGPGGTTGFWFATDVLAANGNTGNIAAGPGVGINLLSGGDAPEPASLILLGSGLVVVATRLRRKAR